jgi:hypothetical protein
VHEGAPKVSSVSRPSNLTDATAALEPVIQVAGLEIEDVPMTDASRITLVSPRRDDRRRTNEHVDESVQYVRALIHGIHILN